MTEHLSLFDDDALSDYDPPPPPPGRCGHQDPTTARTCTFPADHVGVHMAGPHVWANTNRPRRRRR